MTGSTMLNVAYGLGCDSSDDPWLIRMERFVAALTEATLPTNFLVVSPVLAYAPDKRSNIRNSLEYISSFEAPTFLDAWWFFQEVG
jgi:hypothetical protein